jgi:hypothetical protein
MQVTVTPHEASKYRYDIFVNGVQATYLRDADGARRKFEITVDDKRYFIKTDDWQTPREITLLASVADEDKKYFLPVAFSGKDNGIYFLVQEYVEIVEYASYSEPNPLCEEAYREICKIANKYDLDWDLCKYKNWGFINGQPVLFDAVPEGCSDCSNYNCLGCNGEESF